MITSELELKLFELDEIQMDLFIDSCLNRFPEIINYRDTPEITSAIERGINFKYKQGVNTFWETVMYKVPHINSHIVFALFFNTPLVIEQRGFHRCAKYVIEQLLYYIQDIYRGQSIWFDKLKEEKEWMSNRVDEIIGDKNESN